MTPDISVVIPAFNEEKNIGACLTALTKQTTSRPFEVIVVDNNSADATREKAAEFETRLLLRVMSSDQSGRGAARHTGFQHAEGNFICSTDADATVPETWIEGIMTAFEHNPDAVAVTGPCTITDNPPVRNRIFNFLQPVTMKLYRILFGHYWLSGFNFAIKRAAYEKSGGFDPHLNAQEDIDLGFKVHAIGKISYMPGVSVIMSGRRFKKGLIRGSVPYIQTFISYHWFNKKNIFLDNPR